MKRSWMEKAVVSCWMLLACHVIGLSVDRQEGSLVRRLATLSTAPTNQSDLSVPNIDFNLTQNRPADPFEWEEYGRQLKASRYREPYTRTFTFMQNLYQCLAIEFHDAMFRGVDRYSRLPSKTWRCQFFPSPSPQEVIFLVVTTPSKMAWLSEFALLHFLKGMEYFVSKFAAADWVPNFDLTIDGFKEGRYIGELQVYKRGTEPQGWLQGDPLDDGFDPGNGTVPDPGATFARR